MIVRAELVAGAKLSKARVGFDFGMRGTTPQPDLILREANLGIEVKARRLDALNDLEKQLESALADLELPPIVNVSCDERPLTTKAASRDTIVEAILNRIQNGEFGSFVTQLDQPWAATAQVAVEISISDQRDMFKTEDGKGVALTDTPAVQVSSGWTLSGHLQDVEAKVLAVLTDEQKVRQAHAMPTILLVDAARTGMAWIRPPHIWAARLAEQLPQDTPFVGVGLMIPTLDNPDASFSIALRPNAPEEPLPAARKLIHDLGSAAGANSVTPPTSTTSSPRRSSLPLNAPVRASHSKT